MTTSATIGQIAIMEYGGLALALWEVIHKRKIKNNELLNGVIPSSKNIPLAEVPPSLDFSPEEFKEKYGFDKFTKEDDLIFHCRTGGRSHEATRIAIAKGFNARNYKGSIWDWSEIDSDVKRYGPAPFM